MTRNRDAHTHTCPTCQTSYDCPGTLSRNHDGWPEGVCSRYHEAGERDCPTCETAVKCSWCGKLFAADEMPIPDAQGGIYHQLCVSSNS